jgi:outer membrane protein
MTSAITSRACEHKDRTLTWRHFVSKTVGFPAIVTIALALAAPAAAQTKANEPTPEHVRGLILRALDQLNTPAQTSGQTRPASSGPRADLTVEEAVARAMERNVTLASQRLTPRTFDYQLAATRAFYRPNLTSSFSNNDQTQLTTQTIEGGDKVLTDTQGWNAGVQGNSPWGGGSYTSTWNNGRTASNRNTNTFNPNYTASLRGQYTQPLLQNFKLDNTRANLLTQEIAQDRAELDLQALVASTTAQVRNAYWELVYAIANLEASRASLDLSTRLVQDNRARVEIGTLAPIDVVQAQAEEATRRQTVVAAEATLQNNELALKRLIVSGTDDPLWTSTINPVDQGLPGDQAIDLEGAVRNGLSNRTDLQQVKKDIESATVTLRQFSNQTLPSLNAIASYQLDGRGGRPVSAGVAPTNWFEAIQGLGRWDAPTWNVQLQFTYPIGQSQAEANKARQQIIIQQNQTTVKATELQIATEVTAGAIAIRNSREAIQAAGAARELSQKRLEAAQSKLEVGMATNFEVVQAQRDLADARNRELREQLNYRRALVDFQRVQISPR